MNRMFAALLGMLCGLVGCDFSATIESIAPSSKPRVVVPAGPTIRVATFNIQVFGQAKEEKAIVFQRLADVVARFDVVAIQEIRCIDPDFLGRFTEVVRARSGRNFDYTIGPRLGRTSSKEQYAYLFDADRVELAKRTVYTVDDRFDWLHREPFVARFRVRTAEGTTGFSFSLVNVHTDPDEVENELSALDDVLRAVASDGSSEDDIILLGDLNAAPTRFGELGRLDGVRWVIDSEPTNTRRTELYDNVLFDERRTTEFTGRAGVFDIERELNLTREEAIELSDHLPVWAEFTETEAGATVMAGSGPELH